MDDIRICSEALDVAAAVRQVTCPEAGGIDLFLGTTRAEEHAEFGALVALEYEAYEAMAVSEIRRLVAGARGRWPVIHCVVWHRIGRVAVGEASVIVAVGAPHRSEAFEACRFLIDELKKIAPIWKKEVYATGAQWQAEKR